MTTTNNDKKNDAAITFGTQYYGRDKKANKALSTRFYGNSIIVGIHNLLPESQQTKTSKYDYKSGTTIYLTAKSAKALSRLIYKALKAKEEGEQVRSKALPSGANNLIEIGFGDKYGLDADKLCIAVYVVEDKKAKDKPDVFEFKDDVIVVGYDPDNGTYEHELIDTDADYFAEQLKKFAVEMSNGGVHAHKKDNKFSMDRLLNNQIQMMSALGIKNESAVRKTDWNNSSNTDSGEKYVSNNSEDLSKEISNLYA